MTQVETPPEAAIEGKNATETPTKTPFSFSRFMRAHGIYLLLYVGALVTAGCFGVLFTGTLIAAVLVGLLRIATKPKDAKTFSFSSTLVPIFLLGNVIAGFLPGYARSWKSFVGQIALLCVPVVIGIASLGNALFFPASGVMDASMAQKDLAQIETNKGDLSTFATLFSEDYENHTLVLAGALDMKDNTPFAFRNDPYFTWPLAVALWPAAQINHDPKVVRPIDGMMRHAALDTVYMIYSPSAVAKTSTDRGAYYEAIIGKPSEEITVEDYKDLPLIEDPSLIIANCVIGRDGSVNQINGMPFGAQLDLKEFDWAADLVGVCEKIAKDAGAGLPTDIPQRD